MNNKELKPEGFWDHFSNFMAKVFLGAIVFLLLCWLLRPMLGLLIPVGICLIIFTIFIYPVILIKNKSKKEKKINE